MPASCRAPGICDPPGAYTVFLGKGGLVCSITIEIMTQLFHLAEIGPHRLSIPRGKKPWTSPQTAGLNYLGDDYVFEPAPVSMISTMIMTMMGKGGQACPVGLVTPKQPSASGRR